ncbi:MAG: phosphomannomutase/phosphoglucomutase, partial [Gemmatimonadetes bacterium]|nr:phosphomannomutase/phosphoglucomutase [Gemmatimonadota bacterium]
PQHVFREYDIRGVVETDLTPDFVRALGRGLGTMFRRAGAQKVALGRDVRESGERLRDDLAHGLRAVGCDVVDFGRLATPSFYHGCATGPEDAGIQITGSHNPPEFNGFKIVLHGLSFFGEQIQQTRQIMVDEDFETGEGSFSERPVTAAYIADLVAKADLARPVRFAYDSGNGAAALVAADVFAGISQEPVALFDEPDGTFPNHHPDPAVEENLEDLRQAVREGGLELGVAYDGDADRIGVIDDQGQVLWGDQLLILYARDLLSRHPGASVIFDVKCSQTLADAIERAGGQPIIWKTGHSLIKTKMKETKAPLAGEMSGHMFFAEDYYGFDDAIYATLKLLEIVSRSEQPLSRMLADVPKMVSTPEIRVDCPDAIKFDVVRHVTDHFRSRYDVVDIDGVRVKFDAGWGLVRASNTQPALVVRVEATSEEHKNAYHAELTSAIDAATRATGDGG